VPKCWKDLTKRNTKAKSKSPTRRVPAPPIPRWQPSFSCGEDQAFDYLKQLNANISQYTKSGIAPARNAARGETAIGIGFLHDYSLEKEQGAPLELISPCEGTGYEIGGISILKGRATWITRSCSLTGRCQKRHRSWHGKRASLIRS
jgi:iron(III) transport system substrate-binding protein